MFNTTGITTDAMQDPEFQEFIAELAIFGGSAGDLLGCGFAPTARALCQDRSGRIDPDYLSVSATNVG